MTEEQQQYIPDQYQGEEYIYEDDNYGVQRVPSKAGEYQFHDLLTKIKSQINQIKQFTNFSFDWAAQLYYACGWNKSLCMEYILDPNQKHMKLIHYKKEFENSQGYCGIGPCDVCCSTQMLIRNICGHTFCEQCWNNHAWQRFTQSFKDPFPTCILGDSSCDIKMSYSICELLGKKDPKIFEKFIEVLCRSYASLNAFVKICKGKPGFTCTKCFQIKKMYDIIECQNCGNMMCPRCGEKAHGQGQCFQLKNWKQLTENSMDFVDFLKYKICPFCKEGVNKSIGCNYMTCKCGKAFCFYCGQKWQPDHKKHSQQPQDCPNYHRIKQLQDQKQIRRKNKQQFYNKVQERISKLTILSKKQERVDKFKTFQLANIRKQFLITYRFYQSQLAPLKEICSFTQKVLCILWGQTLSFHFEENKKKQFYCQIINQNIDKIYTFLFEFLQKRYNLILKSFDYLNECQKNQLSPQGNIKFQQNFLKNIKQMENIKVKTEKSVEQLIAES